MTPCAELPLPLASTSPWLKVQENTTNFLHGYKLFFCCRLSRLCALSGQKLRTQQIFNRHLLNGKFHMELPSNLTGSQFPRSIYPNEEKMDTDQFRCFFFFLFVGQFQYYLLEMSPNIQKVTLMLPLMRVN